MRRLDQYLSHHALSRPHATAIVFEGREWSYAELDRAVSASAGALLAAGVEQRDRVGVLGRSHPESLIAFLAAGSIGATYVGLDPRHTHHELAHVIDDAQPALVLVTGSAIVEKEEVLDALRRERPELGLVVDPEAHREGAEPAEAREVDDDLAAAIVYTSGSTGLPKGALLSHRSLVGNGRITVDRWLKLCPGWVVDYPITHVAWLNDTCGATIVAGGACHLRERFDPAETVRAIEANRLNAWSGVPAMFNLVVASEEFERADLTSVERIAFGGGALSPAVIDALQAATGATLCNSLGCTETIGGFTFTADEADVVTLSSSVGTPDPHFEVKLVDAAGSVVLAEEPGEILVRSNLLFSGYLNRPDATSEAVDELGWLHTGDIGVVSFDGNIELAGRSREMFKSGGYNVYPAEVETVLLRHVAVREAVVVPVKSELWGEVGAACLVAAECATVGPEDLSDFCRDELANYKIPKRFLWFDSLPRISIGKVDRRRLAAIAQIRGEG